MFASVRLSFLIAVCISMAPYPTGSFLPSRLPLLNFNSAKSSRSAVFGLRSSAQDSDLNRLQTQLNNAIEGEDYQRAADIRDRISKVTGQEGKPDGGWVRIGAPEWLADRAERLGFRMPAQVQRNAMCAVQESSNIVIRSPTGSGKTLAYMIPLLSGLSDDLLDEDLSTYLSRHIGSGATKGQQISSLLRDELPKTPLAIIVVPTRELGVQASSPAEPEHPRSSHKADRARPRPADQHPAIRRTPFNIRSCSISTPSTSP
jgi:hypothetical protein